MTIAATYAELLQLLGIAVPADAPANVRAHVLVTMNAALQMMAVGGEDFFGRKEISVQLIIGTANYVLPKTVQTVLGGIQLSDGTQLTKLTSRGQFRHYASLFRGETSDAIANAKPEAYWVESNLDPTTDDTVAITLFVTPPPDATYAVMELSIPVIEEPTELEDVDLDDDVFSFKSPHGYVESIFLPIARYNLTDYYLFYDPTRIPKLQADYERALNVLGIADPRKPKPTAESNDDSLRLRQPAQQAV